MDLNQACTAVKALVLKGPKNTTSLRGLGWIVAHVGIPTIKEAIVKIVALSPKVTPQTLQYTIEAHDALKTLDPVSGSGEYIYCDRRGQRRDPMVCLDHCCDPEGTWAAGSRDRIRECCRGFSTWVHEQGEGFDPTLYLKVRRKMALKARFQRQLAAMEKDDA